MKKNILITGENRGLGLGLRKLYEAEGYNVIGLSRTLGYDLDDIEAIHDFCDTYQFTFFDKVILNAGTAGIEYGRENSHGRFNYWSKIMRINCINQAVLLHFIKDRVKDKVAFISSESALYPRMLARENFDSFQKLAYKTSKVSMNMCAMYFSREFNEIGNPIPVVIYAPGSVDTNFERQFEIKGKKKTPISEVSLNIKNHFDQATMEDNGKFYLHDGTLMDW